MLEFSVVIPTLNAGREIEALLTRITSQTMKPKEILVVDSASDDETVKKASSFSPVAVIGIERADFNHGRTRDFAVRKTTCEMVCFLTQDAMPVDDYFFANLLAPLVENLDIGAVSGRQLPRKNARRFEQLVREYSYPPKRSVKGIDSLASYGIRTFSLSDVCSAYRKSAYLGCGGFPPVNTNEDMLMAARLIEQGWKVAYEPSACVYHSHNLTPFQQYRRNRDIGEFLEVYKADLLGVRELGEGRRLASFVSKKLVEERAFHELSAFGIDCVARLAGNRAGRIRGSRKVSVQN